MIKVKRMTTLLNTGLKSVVMDEYDDYCFRFDEKIIIVWI